jgi:hypothetical protein
MTAGYKKLSGFMTTLAGSELGGQEIIQFIWDQFVANSDTIEPMPDKVAFGIFVLLGAFVMWWLKEDQPLGELQLVPAYPPPNPRHGVSRSATQYSNEGVSSDVS